jgi:hypothetical protein
MFYWSEIDVAPAEDKALRGRNLSADRGRINGRSGRAARPARHAPAGIRIKR